MRFITEFSVVIEYGGSTIEGCARGKRENKGMKMDGRVLFMRIQFPHGAMNGHCTFVNEGVYFDVNFDEGAYGPSTEI
jgi:hypothetical protein